MSSMKLRMVHTAGVSLVEVIIGIAVIASIVFASGLAVTQMVEARERLVDNTKALYLTEEGYELLRAVRDNDWSDIDALTVGDTYYFSITPGAIAITGTPEVVDGEFTRSFVIDEVSRDNDDDIVPNGTSGATVDDELREVTVTVVGPSGTKTLTGILGNIYSI